MTTNALKYQQDSLFSELVNQLISLFGVFLDTDGASKKTRSEYASDLRHFLSWVSSGKQAEKNRTPRTHTELMTGISQETIEAYKTHLVSRSVPRSTINRRLSALRIFFRCSVAHGWTRDNPAAFVANLKKQTSHLEKLDLFTHHLTRLGFSDEQKNMHRANVTEFLIWLEKRTIKNT